MYTITEYTKRRAKKLGLIVKPSKNAQKKIDVYDDNGNYIASIGSSNNLDYPTYKILEKKGEFPKGYADVRRKLFRLRNKGWKSLPKTSPGYLSYNLLW
jgi:hypothetical protein